MKRWSIPQRLAVLTAIVGLSILGYIAWAGGDGKAITIVAVATGMVFTVLSLWPQPKVGSHPAESAELVKQDGPEKTPEAHAHLESDNVNRNGSPDGTRVFLSVQNLSPSRSIRVMRVYFASNLAETDAEVEEDVELLVPPNSLERTNIHNKLRPSFQSGDLGLRVAYRAIGDEEDRFTDQVCYQASVSAKHARVVPAPCEDLRASRANK